MAARRFFLILALVALEAMLLLLAHWQWNRYHQRLQEAATFKAQPLTTLPGTFLNNQTAALDNQPNPANPQQVGWRILTPFQTSETIFLIDRGWTPAATIMPPNFTPYATSATTVAGILQPYPQRHGWLKGPDTSTHPRLLLFLNPAAVTSSTLAPQYLIAQTPTTGTTPAAPPLPNPQRHFSYMLQWLGLALALPLLALSLLKRNRR